MTRKIAFLSLLVTLAYWLGGAVGCATPGDDQNYRELDEDRPMFETDDPTQPGAEAVPDEEVLPTEALDAAMAELPAPVSDTEPSLRGLDRSHWPIVRIGPGDGTVRHGPHYLRDCPGMVPAHPLGEGWDEATTEQRLLAAMAGEENGGWCLINLVNAGGQPLAFAAEMVLLPAKAVMAPPWSKQTKP